MPVLKVCPLSTSHSLEEVGSTNSTSSTFHVGAYEKLTVPVFGTEVVYDVDNATFMEQKKCFYLSLGIYLYSSFISI